MFIKDIRTHITMRGKVFHTIVIKDKTGLATIYLEDNLFQPTFKNSHINNRLKITIKPIRYTSKMNYKHYLRTKKNNHGNFYHLVNYINKGKD